MTWHVSDWLRKRIEENIREGRPPLTFKLYPHQEVMVEFIDVSWAPEAEFQSRPRRGTIKNGFVGPMSNHSKSMQTYRTLNLDPSEWRRL